MTTYDLFTCIVLALDSIDGKAVVVPIRFGWCLDQLGSCLACVR